MPNYTNTLSSFEANGALLNVSAHNIANVNTDGFRAQRAYLETGAGDQGVQLAAVSPTFDPDPAIINHVVEREPRYALEQTAQGMRDAAAAYTDSRSYEYGLNNQADSYAAWRTQEHRHFTDAHDMVYAQGSNTNLPLEFANMLHAETAYSSNAAVVRTLDTMTGSLLNAIA